MCGKKGKAMKIKSITDQFRRDFDAIMVCEHCGHEQPLSGGYDDTYYHKYVIPNIPCKSCGKKASENYRPLATKYDDSVVI